MAKRNLRVATDADATKKKAKSLVEAAQDGTYREMLEAQRMDIARSLQDPTTQGPARAALHRQLGQVARELRDMDATEAQESAASTTTDDEAFDASAV